MWELDCKESWAPKNWCFWSVMLEKSRESFGLQGDQSWIFIGRTDAKRWLSRKDPDAAKDWRQEEKGMTEDKIVGWHHWLNGHEFEQAPGDDERQGNLACYSPWGCRIRHNWATKQQHIVDTNPDPAPELQTLTFRGLSKCSTWNLECPKSS